MQTIQEASEATFKVILDLMFKHKVFSMCPKCDKYLTLFEVYNENCAECGKIKFEEMIVMEV